MSEAGPICRKQFPENVVLHHHVPVQTKGDLRGVVAKAKRAISDFGYAFATIYWSHHSDGMAEFSVSHTTNTTDLTNQIWKDFN